MTPKPTILLIDDDEEDRLLLRSALSDVFDLVEVGTMLDGLLMLAQARFDLVLLDLTLPDSDREQTLGRVLAEHPDQPPVIVTGYANPDFVQRMGNLGARDYLIKGRDDKDGKVLVSRLNQLLQHANSVRKLGEATEMITKTKQELETDFTLRPSPPSALTPHPSPTGRGARGEGSSNE
jgi:two-component system cell cycle sensor histidine kinase/response regulator CckA